MAQQTSAPAAAQSYRNLFIILCAGFVLSGIATTIVGPMLPVFIRRWSLDDGQACLFSTVQFIAAWCGTLASTAIVSWRGYRTPLMLGYLLMGAGLFFLNADVHRAAMIAVGTYGFGYGLITPGTNLLVAEVGGAKSASLLNLLNSSWGVGAMACSPLIALALRRNAVSGFLAGFAAFGGLIMLCLLFASFGKQEHSQIAESSEQSVREIGLAVTIALASLFFVYVAVENGIGIWAAEYAKRLASGITGTTTLAPAFFYSGLTSGRAFAPLALHRASERNVVLSALGLTVIGTISLIASTKLAFALAAIFIAGLGCASVYPIFIAWLSRWYGPRAKKIGGALFALASLGGSAGPWLVGFTSKLSGSLRIGFTMPLLGIVIMVFLVLALRRQTSA
jgi:MFS transporter, FHS family, glucose/mannose:H+ symporter